MNSILRLIGVPNPWAILAVVLALIGSYWAGNHEGHKAENIAWTAKEQQQIADNQRVAREVETAQAARFAEIEGRYLDEKKKREDLDRKYAGAVSRGLWDAKGTCKQSVPSTPTGAADPAPGPAGCQLSPEASRFLWSEAGRADDAALYGQAGHSLAVGK